ncbi:MAG: hypothetical protein NTY19_16875 [Planctomycetota bacterium]|nr:hypothetical protein [Planctomycetota bacterium]
MLRCAMPFLLFVEASLPAVASELVVTSPSEDRRMTSEEQNRQKEKQGFVKPIEAIVFYLDGRLLQVRYGAPRATFEVDTTTLSDGPHLLRATAWAFQEGVPPVAQLQLPVIVDNHQASPYLAKSAETGRHVPALNLPGVPHFSRHGKLLTRYAPQKSLWVRSLFTLSPRAVAQDERLAARAREPKPGLWKQPLAARR